MDRSEQVKLIAETYTKDELLQDVPVETERLLFCQRRSASRREWEASGQQGLKPEYEITLFAPEYQGEKIAALLLYDSWERFAVYRTYEDPRTETITLYLTRDVGAAN